LPSLLSSRASADPADDHYRRAESTFDKFWVGKVGPSADFTRIAGLLRRPRPDLNVLIKELTAKLKRPKGTQELRPMQAWALHEAPLVRGLLGSMALGSGKTLTGLLMPMVWPNCKRAVLLIPPKLRVQLLEHDLAFYGQHWKLPSIAGKVVVEGRPILHVVAYSELSGTNSSTLLEQLKPDLILCDEVHKLKSYTAARTKRFFRYLAANQHVSLCGWSGTITATSIRDYTFLAAVMLGDGSPVPFNEPALGEWAAALDAEERFIDPGVLRQLCVPGEDVRSGYRRRLIDTMGVVASAEEEIGNELSFIERKLPPTPQVIIDDLKMCRAKEPRRPDKEILLTPLDVTRCARQLACGFYSFWKYPRGEPEDLIKEWFEKRQHWNRELREKLKDSQPHLDSPKLCENAAERFLKGGCRGCERGPKEEHRKGCREAATHPLWNSYTWSFWRDIKDRVYHETATKWESDFVIQDAAAWAKESVGIVWVEFVELGHKIAQLAKIPYYGEGENAARGIANETGKRSVVLSIAANSEGLNLQDRFFRNLFTTFPSDAKLAGQTVGRTHRPGQKEDEVIVEYYAHTQELKNGIESARNKADYSTETIGAEHKLTLGTWVKTAA